MKNAIAIILSVFCLITIGQAAVVHAHHRCDGAQSVSVCTDHNAVINAECAESEERVHQEATSCDLPYDCTADFFDTPVTSGFAYCSYVELLGDTPRFILIRRLQI
ncbi:MAG: hypothetical protein FGM33_09490 [Candidatus Kapabacteria bacterium]|nr:hypothetical protein [Candidatus Kapabacteria bacterium]